MSAEPPAPPGAPAAPPSTPAAPPGGPLLPPPPPAHVLQQLQQQQQQQQHPFFPPQGWGMGMGYPPHPPGFGGAFPHMPMNPYMMGGGAGRPGFPPPMPFMQPYGAGMFPPPAAAAGAVGATAAGSDAASNGGSGGSVAAAPSTGGPAAAATANSAATAPPAAATAASAAALAAKQQAELVRSGHDVSLSRSTRFRIIHCYSPLVSKHSCAVGFSCCRQVRARLEQKMKLEQQQKLQQQQQQQSQFGTPRVPVAAAPGTTGPGMDWFFNHFSFLHFHLISKRCLFHFFFSFSCGFVFSSCAGILLCSVL